MAHQARKRFGQNFLIDDNIAKKILQAIHPTTNDQLIEIGPGKGALTWMLLKKVETLDVVEIDRDLCQQLTQHNNQNLVIHNHDALKFDFRQLYHGNKLRIVGNLPYNISTPLLFHLFSFSDVTRDMYFMLQKEVVDRLAAKPGSKQYGRLSVMTQYYADVGHLFNVSARCFSPEPKVQSAVVQLTMKPKLENDHNFEKQLEQIVKLAFAQRRKTLHNNLKSLINANQLIKCDIDPAARAETLTLEQFVRLAKEIS